MAIVFAMGPPEFVIGFFVVFIIISIIAWAIRWKMSNREAPYYDNNIQTSPYYYNDYDPSTTAERNTGSFGAPVKGE